MQPGGVVDVIDEGRQVRSNILEGLVFGDVDRLDFQRLHEALGLGVVIRISFSTHGSDESVEFQDAPMPRCGVLGSPVSVKDAARRRTPGPDRRIQRCRGETGIDVAAETVTDDFARPSVQNNRQIDEAGAYGDIGDIPDPELVGSVDLEIACDIGVNRTVVIAVGRRDVAAFPLWVQIVFPHDPPHFLRVHSEPAVPKLGGDTTIAVIPTAFGDRPDYVDHRIFLRLIGSCVEAGTRQIHQFAPPSDRDCGGPVSTDPGALLCGRSRRRAPFRNSISSA